MAYCDDFIIFEISAIVCSKGFRQSKFGYVHFVLFYPYFVLYLCRDLNYQNNGSKFWYFCNNFSVNFSTAGGKIIWYPVYERGALSKGSSKSKIL